VQPKVKTWFLRIQKQHILATNERLWTRGKTKAQTKMEEWLLRGFKKIWSKPAGNPCLKIAQEVLSERS